MVNSLEKKSNIYKETTRREDAVQTLINELKSNKIISEHLIKNWILLARDQVLCMVYLKSISLISHLDLYNLCYRHSLLQTC
jgi:hypothetical protein